MAFTGTPVVGPIGKYTAKVGNVSLAGTAFGTIGLPGSGAEVELPDGFPSIETLEDGGELLRNVVEARVTTAAGGSLADIRVDYTVGPFSIVITNEAADGTSGQLTIWVQYHVSHAR